MARRLALLASGIAALALTLAPAPFAAASPATGCTQTNSPPPGEPTEWTCYTSRTDVAGYEVRSDYKTPVPVPPVAGSITHMETDVVDENSVPVPISRLMLHHIVFFNANAGHPDAACGGPERFYGAGEERAKISLPAGYGYPLDPSDNWFLIYMFMNHRAQTDHAWIEYKLTVDPDPGIRPVRSYWMDVGNCRGDPIYNVPGTAPKAKKGKKTKKKGKRKRAAFPLTNVRTKDVTVAEDGWIIAGSGHVHGGAKKLTLTKPGCGDMQVAESNPTWGNPDHPFYNVKPVLHEPGPIGMSAFQTPTGIPVRNGQKLRVNSIYDNTRPHMRVMGIMVLYAAADPPGGATPSECGGPPPDIVYSPGTNLPGRSESPPFTVPLTALDAAGNAVSIDGPPGPFRRLGLSPTVTVGDRWFSAPNVVVRQGATITYRFMGQEAHNVTLANGPEGFGSANLSGGVSYSQTFSKPGTYRLFCAWHPVQMHERVVVESLKKKKRKKK